MDVRRGPSFGADDSLVAAAWLRGRSGSWTCPPTGWFRPCEWRVRMTPPSVLTGDSSPWRSTSEAPQNDGAVFDVRTGEEAFRLSAPNCCSSRSSGWCPGVPMAVTSPRAARTPPNVWDAETERLRHTLLGQTGFVLGLAWSPDSSRLVTGGSDGTARVWEIRESGVRELWSLPAQETSSWIVGVAFSPDGTRVMTGDAEEPSVKIWDLGPTGDAEWTNLPVPTHTRWSSCRTDGAWWRASRGHSERAR